MSWHGDELVAAKLAKRGAEQTLLKGKKKRQKRGWKVIHFWAPLGEDIVCYHGISREHCEKWLEKRSREAYPRNHMSPETAIAYKERCEKKMAAYRIEGPKE